MTTFPIEVTHGFRLVQDEIRREAYSRLSQLVAAGITREQLIDIAPEIFGPLGDLMITASVKWYDELRELQEVSGGFMAEPLESVSRSRWHSLAGYGTSSVALDEAVDANAFGRIAGGLTWVLTEASFDTIIGNAEIDANPVGYQRVPSPGCCAFCAMLASRGASYGSYKSAKTVVGRGTEIPKVRRRGGQAKGLRPRGSRRLGDSFHDYCRCTVVAVHEGNSFKLEQDADRYYEQYSEAAKKVSDGQEWTPGERDSDGNRTTKGRWVDASGKARSDKEKKQQILASMRAELGMR